jgi:AraC-like DNA-binding protein
MHAMGAMGAMDVLNRHQTQRDAARVQANREELVERIGRAITEDGTVQVLPGVALSRLSMPNQPVHGVLEPSLAVVAQGSKEVLLGERPYRYDPAHYLLTTVALPTVYRVLEASRERPYLCLRVELPPALVSSVMVEAGHAMAPAADGADGADVRAAAVSPLDENLLDAVVRLVRLVDAPASPAEARVLLPLVTREIIYWLLIGEQGSRLRYLAVLGGYAPHIARAVEWLRRDFAQPLRIEGMARELGMSVSGFHQHFKSLSGMSPLQFQKQLRLQEARRLMLSEGLEAASAATRVGYHDAAYFNREYKSLFGVPPMRDIQRLRQEALVGV